MYSTHQVYEQTITSDREIQQASISYSVHQVYLIDWVYLQNLANVSTTYQVYQTDDVYQVVFSLLNVSAT